jgi:hypothetical protein
LPIIEAGFLLGGASFVELTDSESATCFNALLSSAGMRAFTGVGTTVVKRHCLF